MAYRTDKLQGPIYFQDAVRTQVMEHRRKEENQGGRQLWPASPKPVAGANTAKHDEDEEFCSQLEAAGCMAKPELAW